MNNEEAKYKGCVAGTLRLKMSQEFSYKIRIGFADILWFKPYIAFSWAEKNRHRHCLAIWSGMGITAIDILGVLFYKESMTLPNIISIALIMALIND